MKLQNKEMKTHFTSLFNSRKAILKTNKKTAKQQNKSKKNRKIIKRKA